jgi:erythronate-4-phosphate dehydrogenase
MRILADDNIPGIERACAALGSVTLFSSLDTGALPALLREADAFLCRSTIRVNEALIQDTPVRFVATATAGFEHVDTTMLAERGIRFASASGSNALSVAEYVFAALFSLGCDKDFDPREMSVGIVGAGHVGTWVAHIADMLGMPVVLCDPPLADATSDAKYRPLEEALAAGIVTLHVPLTGDGPYPTRNMIGREHFRRMRKGAIFINTSRGGVLQAPALLEAVASGTLRAAVLDVFPGEPSIDPILARAADIATPHIAGHSLDGKLLGTQMVAEALAAFAGRKLTWNYLDELPPPPRLAPRQDPGERLVQGIHNVLREVYAVAEDHDALGRIVALPAAEAGPVFARYRSEYRGRREFHSCTLDAAGLPDEVRASLTALGFNAPE